MFLKVGISIKEAANDPKHSGVGYIQKWQKKNSYLWTSKATMEEKILKIRRSANVDSQNQDLVATIAHR